MKVQDTHKAEKAQNNQAIAKTLAGSRSTAKAAKDAVLAQEFSDLMAKIADQLHNVQGEADLPGMSALLKAENSARAQAAAKQETPKTDGGNGKDKQPNENKGPSAVAVENKQAVAAKKEDKAADRAAKDDKKADKDSDDNAQSDSQAASSASDAPAPIPAKPTDAKPVKEHADQEDAEGQTQQQATPNQNQEQPAANQQNNNPAPQANVVAQAAAEQVPVETAQTPQATPAQKCASPVKEEVAQATAQPQTADTNSGQNQPKDEAAAIQNVPQSPAQAVKSASQAPVAPQAAAQAQAAAPVVENVESAPAQAPVAGAPTTAAPEVQAVNNSATPVAVTDQVAKPVVDKPVSDQALFFEQLINRVGSAQRDVPVAQDREAISALRDATISPLILKDSMDAALVKGLDSSKGLLDAKATSTFNLSTQAIEASNLRQTETAAKTELAKAVKPLPRPVEVRTMEKIENALKEAARSKDGKTISLRLDPPSLGSVKVDVTLKDNALHARVVGETPQVNNLLRERAPELQQMLRKLGLNVDKVNVSVSGDDQARQEASFAGQTGLGTNRRQTQRGNLGQGTVLNQDDSARIRQQYEVTDHWVA